MVQYRIGVVGAGRVGAALAAALRDAGHHVVAASGESSASRTRIETLLPEAVVADPRSVAGQADLLLLTMPDDVLAGVVASLVDAGALRPDHVVVHTSGRHGVATLAPAAALGAATVALHPAMTFTGTDVDLDRLSTCVFGVTTADDSSAAVARELVADLGAMMTVVPEHERARYHAALAHGANHLATLVTQAMGLLRQAGSTDPSATLRPLLRAALDNALAYGDAALTGPVVRGDLDTVSAHLDALADSPAPTFYAYRVMARATAELAVEDGRLARSRAREIAAALDEAVWEETTTRIAERASAPGSWTGRR
jgi:predicted short-subunit dehydrogenase-like oxidoreductase (DUF2520 family)